MSTSHIIMKRPNLDGLPPVVMPEGCSIRTFKPGDEQIWADIMNTGVGSGWNVEKVVQELTSKPQFDPQGLFFVMSGDEAVASACAWRRSPEEREEGIVHMVCVLPHARGMNLGYLVTLRVLHYFRDHSLSYATLSTDDHRIPAIKMYLRLGFEPVYADKSHVKRWERIKAGMRHEA